MDTHCILRIVAHGAPAANVGESDDDMDFEAPCDLVALVNETVDDGCGIEEREVDRKCFATGREASHYLMDCVSGVRGPVTP